MSRVSWVAAIVAVFGLLGTGTAQAIDFYRFYNTHQQNVCIGLQQSTGPNLVVGACNAASFSQQWFDKGGWLRLEWDEYPPFEFEFWQIGNRQTNTCIGVAGGSTASGERLVIGPCQPLSDHSQLWASVYTGGGTYVLVNGRSKLCVGTRGSSLAGGTPVLQGTCAFTHSQHWVRGLL